MPTGTDYWAVNSTLGVRVWIGLTEVTLALVNGSLQDSAAMQGSICSTSGTIKLASVYGGPDIANYNNALFQRGSQVQIECVLPNGQLARHPRGHLYVINTEYNPGDQTLDVEVGCLLALKLKTEQVDNLFGFVPEITVPADERTPTTLSAVVESMAAYLWQDRWGNVLKGEFFSARPDRPSTLSYISKTTGAISPLGSSDTPPDKIVLSYSWVVNVTADTGDSLGSGSGASGPTSYTDESVYTATNPVLDTTYTAKTITTTTIKYDGPGKQESFREQVTYKPGFEVAGEYFTAMGNYDKTLARRGESNLLAEKRTTTNEYGQGGEVIRRTENVYKNMLNAITEGDYKEDSQNCGYDPNTNTTSCQVSSRFNFSFSEGTMYLDSQSVTGYTFTANSTTETTETYMSAANYASPGISSGAARLNATTNGRKRTDTRTSFGSTVNPPASPAAPEVTQETMEAVIEDVRYPTIYLGTDAGPIVLRYSLPYSYFTSQSTAITHATKYLAYMRNRIEGEAGGFQVTEAMRPELFCYEPGNVIYIYDPDNSTILKCRADSASWVFDSSQAVVSIAAIYEGISNGTLALDPENQLSYKVPLARVNAPADGAAPPASPGNYTNNGVELISLSPGPAYIPPTGASSTLPGGIVV